MKEFLQFTFFIIGCSALYIFWGKLFALLDKNQEKDKPTWFQIILMIFFFGSFYALLEILGIELPDY